MLSALVKLIFLSYEDDGEVDDLNQCLHSVKRATALNRGDLCKKRAFSNPYIVGS